MTKPNIPKHPCTNKCSEFQCNHCLIPVNSPELESTESDFLVGDVVVLTKELNFVDRDFNTDELLRVVSRTRFGGIGITLDDISVIYVDSLEIRTATVAELHANRRLEAEHAVAEVS